MKIHSLCASAIIAAATPTLASAATTLPTAPIPSWVKAVQPAAAPKSAAGQAAFRILLQDQQVDLQPGHVTRYLENVVKVETPQGLSAGAVTLAWNPDTDTPAVHRLLIRRGDKIIDVLASQQFTIVRRESNLENAMLDGVLTATLQPEGLQVGDVIDFAASIAQTDPALGHHVETVAGGWNGLPIGRAHLWVRWPSNIAVRQRTTTGLPSLKVERKGGVSSVETTLDDLPPVAPPKGAPARYSVMRVAELSDFSSWADLATLMGPLYQKAAMLPSNGALAKEIATIAAQSTDPKARAQAALTLVQDRVRYVFLGMNDGGLVPADAETTWQRRFGDCKGKTVLLLALLKGLGIDAEPVVVSMGGGDGLDRRLPMIALFNHVLVRATIGGRTFWLDGTRTGDASLDQIQTPDFRWGLPLMANATLIPMEAPPPSRPQTQTTIRIDASAGVTLPSPMHVETVIRDDGAVAMDRQLSNMAPDALDRGLREYWRGKYDFVTVKSVTATFDPASREERLVMDGDAKLDWNNGWYQADGVGVGYKADFTRDPGPNRDAPFAVAFPYSIRASETILLPPGHFKLFKGDTVDETAGGIAYHRTASLENQRFIVEEDEHSIEREFPADQADVMQTRLRALDDKNVFIGKPDDYVPTGREMGAMMKEKPSTADGFIERGNILLDRVQLDEAIADFSSALALDPKNAQAFADRGVAYAQQQKADDADRDFAAAEKLSPDNAVLWRGRALLADQLGETQAAIAAYSKSLEIEPTSIYSLVRRALDYHKLGDNQRASADADAAIRTSPSSVYMYLLRANIARAEGKDEEAMKQAALAVAAAPQDPWAHVIAARIDAAYRRWDDAAREFDAALKIQTFPDIYANRSLSRPVGDFEARQADLDAAKALSSRSVALYAAQAKLQEDRKAYTDAVATWTAWLAINPDDAYALLRRGIDEQRAGDEGAGAIDFSAAHAMAKGADVLSALCREEASANLDLDLAVEECRAAVKMQPSQLSFQKDLEFVELRLKNANKNANSSAGDMPKHEVDDY